MEEDLVRMATELTRQANQMHEMQLELQRIATTTSQAEERAKVAEEKACAAVMAIGMVKTPEQKKAKLNNRDAEKFWPETYTADRVDKKSFAELLGEVETHLSVLAPGLLARPLLEWAAAFLSFWFFFSFTFLYLFISFFFFSLEGAGRWDLEPQPTSLWRNKYQCE